MAVITEKMVINDVVRDYPATMKVFNKFNLDSCCGGANTIAASVMMAGADLKKVLEELNAAAKK
jgi:regulator of cell morphogenesis and NO signaling